MKKKPESSEEEKKRDDKIRDPRPAPPPDKQPIDPPNRQAEKKVHSKDEPDEQDSDGSANAFEGK